MSNINTYTEKVVDLLPGPAKYPVIHFDINVDGTGCLLIKDRRGRYYTNKLTYEEMKRPAYLTAAAITRAAAKHFKNL